MGFGFSIWFFFVFVYLFISFFGVELGGEKNSNTERKAIMKWDNTKYAEPSIPFSCLLMVRFCCRGAGQVGRGTGWISTLAARTVYCHTEEHRGLALLPFDGHVYATLLMSPRERETGNLKIRTEKKRWDWS